MVDPHTVAPCGRTAPVVAAAFLFNMCVPSFTEDMKKRSLSIRSVSGTDRKLKAWKVDGDR